MDIFRGKVIGQPSVVVVVVIIHNNLSFVGDDHHAGYKETMHTNRMNVFSGIRYIISTYVQSSIRCY